MKLTLTTPATSIVIGEGGYGLSAPIEGLEIPAIRTSSQNYSGRDGGRVNAQYYSPRLITISGYLNENSCENLEDARKDLQSGLPIRTPVTITILTPANELYVTDGYVIDFKMPYISKLYSEYKFDILCRSAYFLSATQNVQRLDKVVGGGFIIPFILPVIFGDGAGTEIITNLGTEPIYPIMEFHGVASNPRITNNDTGEYVGFDITTSSDDVIIVDMNERTATLNGGSILSFRQWGSSWWALPVGQSRLSFSTSVGTDDGYALVKWRNAVLTI